jgi:hypothetical protein
MFGTLFPKGEPFAQGWPTATRTIATAQNLANARAPVLVGVEAAKGRQAALISI